MRIDRYRVGSKNVPSWCRNDLTPYQKNDGSVGFEYYGKHKTIQLKAGDKIENRDGKIIIQKNKGR